mmetsp:Transcript_51251/g.141843  ORF Transcript_51251/g.141843 Transcript_51251/m.141843 type:complete len:250 (-) Transcript_51251:326-1075(-)
MSARRSACPSLGTCRNSGTSILSTRRGCAPESSARATLPGSSTRPPPGNRTSADHQATTPCELTAAWGQLHHAVRNTAWRAHSTHAAPGPTGTTPAARNAAGVWAAPRCGNCTRSTHSWSSRSTAAEAPSSGAARKRSKKRLAGSSARDAKAPMNSGTAAAKPCFSAVDASVTHSKAQVPAQRSWKAPMIWPNNSSAPGCNAPRESKAQAVLTMFCVRRGSSASGGPPEALRSREAKLDDREAISGGSQ